VKDSIKEMTNLYLRKYFEEKKHFKDNKLFRQYLEANLNYRTCKSTVKVNLIKYACIIYKLNYDQFKTNFQDIDEFVAPTPNLRDSIFTDNFVKMKNRGDESSEIDE
jgi:hypothetical protein